MSVDELQQLRTRLLILEKKNSKKAAPLKKEIKKREDTLCDHKMFILKEINITNGKKYYKCVCIQNGCEREFDYLDNRIYLIDDIRLYVSEFYEIKPQIEWFESLKKFEFGEERTLPDISNCFDSISSVTNRENLFPAYLSTLQIEWQKIVDSYTPDACPNNAYPGIKPALFVKHLRMVITRQLKK